MLKTSAGVHKRVYCQVELCLLECCTWKPVPSYTNLAMILSVNFVSFRKRQSSILLESHLDFAPCISRSFLNRALWSLHCSTCVDSTAAALRGLVAKFLVDLDSRDAYWFRSFFYTLSKSALVVQKQFVNTCCPELKHAFGHTVIENMCVDTLCLHS